MFSMEQISFLVHNSPDHVGVATRDISEGEVVKGKYLDNGGMVEVKALELIPLGHKISLSSIRANEPVVEYGQTIGTSTSEIERGSHVHTHNIRSRRW